MAINPFALSRFGRILPSLKNTIVKQVGSGVGITRTSSSNSLPFLTQSKNLLSPVAKQSLPMGVNFARSAIRSEINKPSSTVGLVPKNQSTPFKPPGLPDPKSPKNISTPGLDPMGLNKNKGPSPQNVKIKYSSFSEDKSMTKKYFFKQASAEAVTAAALLAPILALSGYGYYKMLNKNKKYKPSDADTVASSLVGPILYPAYRGAHALANPKQASLKGGITLGDFGPKAKNLIKDIYFHPAKKVGRKRAILGSIYKGVGIVKGVDAAASLLRNHPEEAAVNVLDAVASGGIGHLLSRNSQRAIAREEAARKLKVLPAVATALAGSGAIYGLGSSMSSKKNK